MGKEKSRKQRYYINIQPSNPVDSFRTVGVTSLGPSKTEKTGKIVHGWK